MTTCEAIRDCRFHQAYAEHASFRAQHFHYFCFGPLAESCARRVFSRHNGVQPRVDYSPLGVPLALGPAVRPDAAA